MLAHPGDHGCADRSAVPGDALGGIAMDAVWAFEVWCDLPPAEARERFDARATERHSIHDDRLDRFGDAKPLGICPVVLVDTRLRVDFDVLLPELAQHLLG